MARKIGTCRYSGHMTTPPPAAFQLGWDPTDGKTQLLCPACIKEIGLGSAEDYSDNDTLEAMTGKYPKATDGSPFWKKNVMTKTCKHLLQPFTFNDMNGVHQTLYLSASRDMHTTPQSDQADISLYFDGSWVNKLDQTVGTRQARWLKEKPREWYYVPWPDMQALAVDKLIPLLVWTYTQYKRGKTIEAACFGGHGRTGTFAASFMMMFDGWGAQDAIKEVRAKYCTSAIESAAQEKLLEELPQWLKKTKAQTIATTKNKK